MKKSAQLQKLTVTHKDTEKLDFNLAKPHTSYMLQEIPHEAARIPWQAHTVLAEVHAVPLPSGLLCDQAKMKLVWISIFPASR